MEKKHMILVFQMPPEVFLGMFVGVQIPPIDKVFGSLPIVN